MLSLQAVYLKANTTLGVVVGMKFNIQVVAVTGCASLYATWRYRTNGEVIVQVSGCGDSRCSV